MRLAPVAAKVDVDPERDPERQDMLHLVLHQLLHDEPFPFQHLEHQLIMDLHDEAASQTFAAEPVEHVHHRQLDDVRRGTLDGVVDGIPLGKSADVTVGAADVGNGELPAEKRGDVPLCLSQPHAVFQERLGA